MIAFPGGLERCVAVCDQSGRPSARRRYPSICTVQSTILERELGKIRTSAGDPFTGALKNCFRIIAPDVHMTYGMGNPGREDPAPSRMESAHDSNAAGQGCSAATVSGARNTGTKDHLSAPVSLPRSESRGPAPPPVRPARDHMPFWRADSYAGNATCAAALAAQSIIVMAIDAARKLPYPKGS